MRVLVLDLLITSFSCKESMKLYSLKIANSLFVILKNFNTVPILVIISFKALGTGMFDKPKKFFISIIDFKKKKMFTR